MSRWLKYGNSWKYVYVLGRSLGFAFLPANQTYVVKFIYSEKATKFCEISTLLLSYVVPVKRNFVAFSEYMNFTYMSCRKSIGTGKFLIICIYKPLYLEQHKQMNQFL